MSSPAAAGNPRLAAWKAHSAPGDGRRIPVTQRGLAIAALRVAPSAPQPAVLERLSAWRNQHRNAFFSQEPVTPESTGTWLAAIAAREDRILFLVSTLDDQVAGHIGLTGVDESTQVGESDAWLGGGLGPPGIMLCGFAAMLDWAFAELRLARIAARVFADNKPVLRAHALLGFTVGGREAAAPGSPGRAVTCLQLERTGFATSTARWR